MKRVIGTIIAGILFAVGNYLVDQSNTSKVVVEQSSQGGFDYRDPDSTFDATKLNTTQTTITWKVVDNVQVACEKESRKLGNGGFGYMIQACSFWTGNTCTIVTSKNATMHQLGHETLHCFKGNFH
jgi:hypothetical protein